MSEAEACQDSPDSSSRAQGMTCPPFRRTTGGVGSKHGTHGFILNLVIGFGCCSMELYIVNICDF